MPFTVQLDLDTATNAALDGLAQRLDAIPGLTTVRRLGDVHHLSLIVADTFPLERHGEALERFATDTLPLTIRLAGLGVFPGERSVLYLAPVVTGDLLDLHDRFHAAFDPVACWEHYRPLHWVPHVTLAMDIAPDALGPAVTLVRDCWTPGPAHLDTLRLIRFHPVDTLFRQPLT